MSDQDLFRERTLETYRSMIAYGAAAVKAVFLVNGGSAIALLAFMGNVWSPVGSGQVPDVILPMVLFVIGLSLGAVAATTAYFTQLAFYREDLKFATSSWWDKHDVWLRGSIVCVALGLVCFAVGSILAAARFSQSSL